MAVYGRCAIPITEEARDLLKARGADRNVRSYSNVIISAFERIEALEFENKELKARVKQIDSIQDSMTKMAGSFLGSINGNKRR
ncbi:MAG: hypothetical protein P1P69_04165 [Methanosarcinaceae archaeon]|nr:hypothetical protein [Methanosarcinaceae archaeon]